MSTVTPKAKPSVSSVATPSFMLRNGGRALRDGGGGGALDRVEEGRGPADCTDGGEGGPRLAARVEKDVARLDLHAVTGAQVCGAERAAARAGAPARAPRRVGWSAAAATSAVPVTPPSRARRGDRTRRWCAPAGPRACRPRTVGTPGRAAGTPRGSSPAAAAGWRAACTAQAAPPLSAPPWPRHRSHAHPVHRRARHHARYNDHRRARLAHLRWRQCPRSAASRRTGRSVAARAARPPCGTRWQSRPCPRLAQSRRWRSAAPGMSALAGPQVVAGARAVAAAQRGAEVRWGQVVRQQAAA
eukprot:scaffold133391_cov94-Phaeocystis_antarctica.AAC.1